MVLTPVAKETLGILKFVSNKREEWGVMNINEALFESSKSTPGK